MEQEAERLYLALQKTIAEFGVGALMSAGGDLKNKVAFDKANAKTREVFYKLAANLTVSALKA